MEICEHSWIKVHEQPLVGGSFSVGWQCERCNKYVPNSEVTPAGLPGVVTTKHKLVGVHGGGITTESGKKCRAQVYDEATKELTYIG